MSSHLCETFRSLAFKTYDQIGRARRVGHQPLEETFTDTNILELMDRHPKEIFSRVFNKKEEGINGADWEWWLTNRKQDKWLGLRVQAKILHLKSDTFAHLHYKSGKTKKIYQLAKLKSACKTEGLVPLYCLYTHQPISGRRYSEAYGCSLTSLRRVEELQGAGEICDFNSVISRSVPWHRLVCNHSSVSGELPERAWQILQETLGITRPRVTNTNAVKKLKNQIAGPRPQPPRYVLDIIDGRETDVSPKNVRGIVIVRENVEV